MTVPGRPPPPKRRPPHPGARQQVVNWRKHAAIAFLLFLVLGAALFKLKPSLHSIQIEANEKQAINELIEFQTANARFASELNLGGLVAPDILADPERYPIQGVLFLHPRFLVNTRNGYVFEFKGEEEYPQGRPIQPAYESYGYAARPLIPGETGARTFAIYSFSYSVFARSDGLLPTPDDTIVSAFTR